MCNRHMYTSRILTFLVHHVIILKCVLPSRPLATPSVLPKLNTNTPTHAHTRIHTHTHAHAHALTYTHTYIHTRTRSHAHTLTHTFSQGDGQVKAAAQNLESFPLTFKHCAPSKHPSDQKEGPVSSLASRLAATSAAAATQVCA